MLGNNVDASERQGIGRLLAEVRGRTWTPSADPAQALDVETTSILLRQLPQLTWKQWVGEPD